MTTAAVISLSIMVHKGVEREETYENWIIKFRTRIEEIYAELKNIDEREIFQKDDEVGLTFSEIVKVMKEFDEEIK